MAGETGPIDVSRPIAMTIAAFFGITCYNVLEIMVSIFMTFKRYRGLYFWSMLVATLGILLHAIAVLLRFFALAPSFPMAVLIVIGWYAMVTGQSVVLYSRLHLVVSDYRRYRWVLYMIIINFCVLHIPVSILFFGSGLGHSNFLGPFNVYENIQLAGFSVQEIIISGLYIWEASRALKPALAREERSGYNVMKHLILVNIIAILMDASLLATQYSDNFEIQTTYKTVVYSVKLKMEFSVLNQLVAFLMRNHYINEYDSQQTCLEPNRGGMEVFLTPYRRFDPAKQPRRSACSLPSENRIPFETGTTILDPISTIQEERPPSTDDGTLSTGAVSTMGGVLSRPKKSLLYPATA
jgi:hypothetical protein